MSQWAGFRVPCSTETVKKRLCWFKVWHLDLTLRLKTTGGSAHARWTEPVTINTRSRPRDGKPNIMWQNKLMSLDEERRNRDVWLCWTAGVGQKTNRRARRPSQTSRACRTAVKTLIYHLKNVGYQSWAGLTLCFTLCLSGTGSSSQGLK